MKTRMARRVSVMLGAALALLPVCGTSAAGAASEAGSNTPRLQEPFSDPSLRVVEGIVTTEVSAEDAQAVVDYWTPERIAAAVPEPLPAQKTDESLLSEQIGQVPQQMVNRSLGGSGGRAVAAALASPTRVLPSPTSYPAPKTEGLILYKKNGVDTYCAAAVFKYGGYKNTLVTAAHCLWNSTLWNYNSLTAFSPGYYDGTPDGSNYSPIGVFPAKSLALTVSYTYGNLAQDYAVVTVHPQGSNQLHDRVPSWPLIYGTGSTYNNVWIRGYPTYDSRPDFAGYSSYFYVEGRPYSCTGNTASGGSLTTAALATDAGMACAMSGGASGGPWLVETGGARKIFAVSSRSTGYVTLATPFTCKIVDLYNQAVGNTPTSC